MKGEDRMVSKTDRKMCGTCEFWIGDRNPCFDQNSVPKLFIKDKIGICQNVNCKFTDQKRKYDLTCVKYSKWTEIF